MRDGTKTSERHRRIPATQRLAEAREDARVAEGLTLEERGRDFAGIMALSWSIFESRPDFRDACRQRDPVPADFWQKWKAAMSAGRSR